MYGLLIGTPIFTHSQEIRPADTLCKESDTLDLNYKVGNYKEALIINDFGDIVVIRRCNTTDFARFLNTTPTIAQAILEDCIYTVRDSNTTILNTGDTLRFSNADPPISYPPNGLGVLGGIIYRHSGNNLGKFLFSNYWKGGVDIALSNCQFAKILLCIKQYSVALSSSSDTLLIEDSLTANTVSFYHTPYERAFGYATVYVDSEQRIVGFSDRYDFDSKEWGIRPTRYELYVRLVSLISPHTTDSFEVCY